MFKPSKYILLCAIPIVYYPKLSVSEPVYPSTLVLYSPGDLEYTDVLVKREHDNLTLACELRGDTTPRSYVWNYVENGTAGQSTYSVEPSGLTNSSRLVKLNLQLSDSGKYMCSAPPFSVTKYILVQTKSPRPCARSAFWCGTHCVLASYVCDGRRDCLHGEDEDPALCDHNVCARSDKLNCSSGRCISAAACCRSRALCRQPACCEEYPHTTHLGYVDEYPPLFEDRHAPDDYGFIQSTIYTVTACALIFMIAVVLLVSAICKMHMKRAALRGYTHADRATRHHYTMQYAQAHRFPPCYEASRLLEENRAGSPPHSPLHDAPTPDPPCAESPSVDAPRGLARLSSIFSSRYRQVPTQPSDVEMTNVRSTSLQNSPTRNAPLHNYRSPTYCDLNTEFLFANPETPSLGRDLNYMATPIEFFRRRTMRRNTLERVMDQLDRQRLTLQLGRFQLSIPRFGRSEPRPDTPNVAEININDLDFVRLNSNDTYTLNGRTIRLLGANFENYPVLPDGSVRPPSYTEAVRYKLYGPPPEYLSRDGLNRRSADAVDEDAANNIEMPPCYDELSVTGNNGNVSSNNGNVDGTNINVGGTNGNENGNNGNVDGINGNGNGYNSNLDGTNGNVNGNGNAGEINASNSDAVNGNANEVLEESRLNAATNAIIENDHANDVLKANVNFDDSPIETLSSIIDNLPAIDSDVNANETDVVILSDDITNRPVINDNGNVINNVISNNV